MAVGTSATSLGTLAVRLTASTQRFNRDMRMAERTVAGTATRIGAAMTKMGGLATLALGAIGIVGVRQFAKFDAAMQKSLAIMGDVSAGTRKEMEATARSIARNSTTSAEEAAESFFFLASAGLSAEQSIMALPIVEKFAIAGAFDMALATDLLTDAQSALGLTIRDDVIANMQNMIRLSDVLVKANTLSNATVEQFSMALTREAGASLKSFNIDVEEGVAVLAAFADQGVKAELAGTGLSRILRLATAAANNNAEAMDRLGIEVFDTEGKIRNFADFIEDLENAFEGMSDQTRTSELAAIGFSARVQGIILPLLGTSKAIRQYEKDLRDAGGTTEEVAAKQLQALSAQFKIAFNRINDLFIIIGAALAPVLRTMLSLFLDASQDAETFSSAVKTLANFMRDSLLTVFVVISDVLFGFKVAGKVGEIAFLSMVSVVGDSVQTAANFVIRQFGRLIGFLNRAIIKTNEITGSSFDIIRVKFGQIENLAENAGDAALQAAEELNEMLEAGMPSDRIIEQYGKLGDKIKTLGGENIDFIPPSEYAKAVAAAGEELNKAAVEAETLDESLKRLDLRVDAFEVLSTGVAEIDLLNRLQAQENMLKTSFDEQVKLLEEKHKAEEISTKNFNTQMAKFEEDRLIAEENFAAQRRSLFLTSAESTFDSLATMGEAFAGQQSGLFKAMFAISKAFAVADAIVKINQGIANAISLGFPQGLIAAAAVAAEGARIVSAIQAVKLKSFEGGGFTGSGSRSGGVDGRGGFPAILHPNEMVTDLNEQRRNEVTVNVNNFGTDRVTVDRSANGRIIDIIIRKAADDIRTGRGPLPASLEETFQIRRGGART